ncbi:MAG: LysE family translocator [Saprospiraceae bacterium]
MPPFISGLLFGLTLTILLGPIFFALVQVGLERGFKAGFMMVMGIWLSDLLFVLSVYLGVSSIVAVTEIVGFKLWTGIAGGVILILIGVLTLVRKPTDLTKSALPKKKLRASYFVLFIKGFLINTVNPFTFFFWISVMTAVVLEREYVLGQAISFFVGVMLVIIVSDLLKVYGAKYISKKLKPHHVLLMRKISGGALVAFGIILMIRVLWDN